MSNFKGWEIIIVLALLLLLFGAKRLPDAARGLGRSLRIFKAETKGLMDDDDDTLKTDTQRSPEQRELGANPPSLDAESERQAAERRAADHRDDPA
jgi:sec-independent protein translocase protein TatA